MVVMVRVMVGVSSSVWGKLQCGGLSLLPRASSSSLESCEIALQPPSSQGHSHQGWGGQVPSTYALCWYVTAIDSGGVCRPRTNLEFRCPEIASETIFAADQNRGQMTDVHIYEYPLFLHHMALVSAS